MVVYPLYLVDQPHPWHDSIRLDHCESKRRSAFGQLKVPELRRKPEGWRSDGAGVGQGSTAGLVGRGLLQIVESLFSLCAVASRAPR